MFFLLDNMHISILYVCAVRRTLYRFVIQLDMLFYLKNVFI